MQAIRVPCAGVLKELKGIVWQIEKHAPKLFCEVSAPSPMTIVATFILPSRIMENSKQANNRNVGLRARGKEKPVALNATPVVRAMDRIHRRMELAYYMMPKPIKIGDHL